MFWLDDQPIGAHMNTSTRATLARRIVRRITATWSDLDYAQRRLLEIQTGAPGLTRPHDPSRRGRAGELESHL
jgi:hypothetical protein